MCTVMISIHQTRVMYRGLWIRIGLHRTLLTSWISLLIQAEPNSLLYSVTNRQKIRPNNSKQPEF